MAEDVNKVIEAEAQAAVALQNEISGKIAELKATQTKIDETWKRVEEQMIEHNVKSVKGDWGSLTIAERTTYKADDIEAVPRKFIKKTLDTKKVAAVAQLEGDLPKGVSSSVTKYLTKRLK